jgi:hypothetical protein
MKDKIACALILVPLLSGCPGGGSSPPPPNDDGTPAPPRATTFSKSFGGPGFDSAHAALQSSDGGYVFVGAIDGTGNFLGEEDLWINKLDGNGNIEWQRAIGNLSEDSLNRIHRFLSVQATPDGGYVVAGMAVDEPGAPPAATGNDVWVAKYSAAGILEWDREYDSGRWPGFDFAAATFGRGEFADDEATDIQVTPDGGYVVTGRSLANLQRTPTRVAVDASSVMVLKLNATGEPAWQRRLTDGQFSGSEFAPIIRATAEGGAVVGYQGRFDGGIEMRIVRIAQDGVPLWTRREPEDDMSLADIFQTDDLDDGTGRHDGIRDDGFVIIRGDFARVEDCRDCPNSEVMRLTRDGALDWRRSYEGSDRVLLAAGDQFCAPRTGGAAGFDCELVFAGQTQRLQGGRAYVLTTSESGDVLRESVPDNTPSYITDILARPDGRLIALLGLEFIHPATLGPDNARESSARRIVMDWQSFGVVAASDDIPLRTTGTSRPDIFGTYPAVQLLELTSDSGVLDFNVRSQVFSRLSAPDPLAGPLVAQPSVRVSEVRAERGIAVVEIASGSYVVAGRAGIFDSATGLQFDRIWVLRITNGGIDWQRTYEPSAELHAMSPSGDGGVLLVGRFGDGFDFSVLKLTADGSVAWQSHQLDPASEPEYADVQLTPDGGSVVLAGQLSTRGSFEVTRFDAGGNILWQHFYLGASGTSIAPTDDDGDGARDDGFVIGGSGPRDRGVPEHRLLDVVKLDAEGEVMWSRTYGVLGASVPHESSARDGGGPLGAKVGQTADGYILGTTDQAVIAPEALGQPFGQTNVFLLKVNRAGDVLWSRNYGALLDETLRDLRVLADGGLIAAGSSDSLGERSDAWVLRLDGDGLIASGCNALLGSIPTAAIRSQQLVVSQSPFEKAEAVMPVTVRETGVVPRLIDRNVEARQCLGSSGSSTPPPSGSQSTLTVVQAGSLTGVVSSVPAGIVCGTAAGSAGCSAPFAVGSDAFLSVDPGSLNTFLRWEDCDEVVSAQTGGARCRVRMDRDRAVRAVFGEPRDRFQLRFTINGTGTIRSGDDGIRCGTFFGANQDCESFYDALLPGSTLPNSISLAVFTNADGFVSWGGDCAAGGSASGFNLTMDADKNCTATFSDAPPAFDLTVQKTGNGSGRVLSAPTGISCGSFCTASFNEDTTVRLRATPDAASNSTFGGWTGCDRLDPGPSGSIPVCEVDVAAARTVSASFQTSTPPPGPTQTLLTRITFDGRGSIASNPAGIVCSSATGNGGSCVADFPQGSVVRLIPTPEPGFRFVEWRQDPDCADGEVTMNTTKQCEAVFDEAGGGGSSFTLSFTAGQIFGGRVETVDGSINCPGSSCTAIYPAGTAVSLRAIPDNGRVLEAWTQDCEDLPPLNAVPVTMDRSYTCAAAFVTAP